MPLHGESIVLVLSEYRMSLQERVDRLEEEAAQLGPLVELSQNLLGREMHAEPLPVSIEKAVGNLRSARELDQRGDSRGAEVLVDKAEESLRMLRQWLAVTDLAISPFALRTRLEKDPPARDFLETFIRYLLAKQPHADNDRDKLDYLLTTYIAADSDAEPSTDALANLFAGLPSPEPLSNAAEVMLHDLQSLIALVDEFTDFDKLVQARMVERVRALKTNLHDEFYHPQVLAAVIRFNRNFRRHFDNLIQQQLSHVRRQTRELLEQAWTVVRAIEEAHQNLARPPAAARPSAAESSDQEANGDAARVGRPHDLLDERPPLDRLLGHGQEHRKEMELRGIVHRLERFLKNLAGEQASAEQVVFRLRRGELSLQRWEREAFSGSAVSAAPKSTGAIQYALGVVAWMEEELAQYKETSEDRYLWKAHLDVLSYAVARTVELLNDIRGLLREDAPKAEAAWFDSLLHVALRLGTALNRLTPVFKERATA
jgi:hypothetical protein